MAALRIYIFFFLSLLFHILGAFGPSAALGAVLARVSAAPTTFTDKVPFALIEQAGRARGAPGSRADITRTLHWSRNPALQQAHGRSITLLNAVTEKRENELFAARNKIKGAGGEALMDAQYTSEGWEKIDCKRGVTGFDGCYVKRSKSGRIIDAMVVESKTGSSPLGTRADGSRQMSKAAIAKDLEKLIQKGGPEAKFAEYIKSGGKTRYALLRTSFVNLKGQMFLRLESFTISHAGVADGDVKLINNGDRHIDPINPRTKSDKTFLKSFLNEHREEMLRQKVPAKTADRLVAKFETDLSSGKIKPYNGSMERGINRYWANALRHERTISNPREIAQRLQIPEVPPTKLGNLVHNFGRRAGRVGALGSGAFAAFFELKSTGRITSANSGREILLDGGSTAAEYGMAKGAGTLAKGQAIMSMSKNAMLRRVITPANLTRGAGASLVVITAVAMPLYEYSQGKISIYEARDQAVERLAVATVLIGAGKVGMAGCAATGAGAIVAPVCGIVASSVVGLGYYGAKKLYLDERLLEMKRIDDEQQEAIRKELNQRERQRLTDESAQLLTEAGEFLSASRARY